MVRLIESRGFVWRQSRRRALTRLIIGRVAVAPPLILLVSTLIFLVVAVLPGDLATEILGREARPETLANLRQQLGLNLSLGERYLNWLAALAQGDFGASLASGRPVRQLLEARIANTLFLAGLAASMAVPLALLLGVLAALWRDTLFDRGISILTLSAISLPDFFVAYLCILAFAVQLPIFPSIANIDATTSWTDMLIRTTLPALTLTLITLAPMMRMTRAAIINVMSNQYIEMARLKGVSSLGIILRHAVPNVIAPVVTVVMFNLGYMIVGVVIIEVVFAYPGLGQLLVDSVSKRDVPVVQACSIAFASTYILLNLAADLISIVTDPRRAESG